ncbi:MAG: NnrU family protein [Hyphomicrobiales bacterium]
MIELFIASLAFVALHAVPSMPLRARLVRMMGAKVYSALYSVLSLVLLWAMIQAYSANLPRELFWELGDAGRGIMALVLALGFVLVIAGALMANPSSFMMGGAGAIGSQEPAHGILRVTRHPMMMGIGLWALAHMVARPEPGAAIFFGSLALTAIGGAWLQDQRKRQEIGDAWERLQKVTSFLPFGAILTGRNRLAIGEIWWRVVLGLAAWAAFIFYHGTIIGVSAMGF